MRIRYGLTTRNLRVGRITLIWRWNMPLREAIMRTAGAGIMADTIMPRPAR
jgi:hypothetical protein